MENKQKKRSQISDEYKWNLKLIYETEDKFLNELDKAFVSIKEIKLYEGKILKSSKNLLGFLKLEEKLQRNINKLYMYAHLNFDVESSNSKYQEYYGKVENLLNEYQLLSSYAVPEMMKDDYSIVKKFVELENDLKEYAFNLECLYKQKDHILDEKSEVLLASLSKVLDASSETYNYLTDTELKFGDITLEDNTKIELTESNYSYYNKSFNRSVRKEAFQKLLGTYGKYKNTFTSTFTNNIEKYTKLAKIRNFSSSIEASLFDDYVDVQIYDNFINVINDNLSVLHKYYKLRKDNLKLDKQHIYDTYVSLIPTFDKDYNFDLGKKLALDSLSILGKEYIEILNKSFEDGWIDVYNNEGKRSGAYSSGTYDTVPYELLNYENKFNDVLTLVHESGHSLNSYLSNKNQPHATHQYQIFTAEVASTVNELLLCKYVLKNSKDKEEKKYILNQLMDLFKGTIYRQIMFAEFERDCHKKHEDGEILTSESLCNDYFNLNKKYFGEHVFVDEEIKYEWSRIPHFYYNFYVYKYAIGLSCACYIVDGILNEKEDVLKNYLKFLKAGGSDYPVELLKKAGIDVTKKEFILSSIKMFEEVIDEFEKL